jgi:hypothetical protein
MLKNIEDGWLLNTSIRYLPFRFLPMALGQMEVLRRAHNFRPRQWVLPDNLRDAIPARGQLNRQIRVIPNSYLWGFTVYEFITEGEFAFIPIPAVHLSIQITDEATGAQFGSEFLTVQNAGFPTGPTTPAVTTPILLTQPRLITDPGLLSVQIANTSDEEALCQLMLCFLEPCELRYEGEQCP